MVVLFAVRSPAAIMMRQRRHIITATVTSLALSCAGGAPSSSSTAFVSPTQGVSWTHQVQRIGRTGGRSAAYSSSSTLLLRSSHFRDNDSSSKYDALKEELSERKSATKDNGGSEFDAADCDKPDQPFSSSTSTASASASVSVPESIYSKSTVDDLLGMAMGRAARTFSTLDTSSSSNGGGDANVRDLMDAAASRAGNVLLEKKSVATPQNDPKKNEKKKKGEHVDKRTYLSNPAVTPTALAHSLWKSTVTPGIDTVIDATCGNGKDSVALAEILFDNYDSVGLAAADDDDDDVQPELLCIDIQSRAAANTTQALRDLLDDDTFDNNVRVLATSHAPLPLPRDDTSVGLICYNLGWLPGSTSDDKNAFATKMVTTIVSLTDAALLLRVGGLLSVMTYPATKKEVGGGAIEADAVRYFCEGLAMLTTRNKGGWRGYIDSIPPDIDGSGATTVREMVRSSLERVVRDGDAKQTWRVFEHKPLGRPLSPILIAAMRIK